MAEVKDTPGDAIDAFGGSETDDQAEYALRDFSAKDIAIAAANRAGGGAPGGGVAPASVFIVGYMSPKTQTNFDNFSDVAAGVSPFGVRTSDNTNGAFIEWYVPLQAGDYTLVIKGWPHDGGGILTFSIDGTEIDASPHGASNASYDGYAGAENANANPTTVADDITIETDDTYVLRATVDGKNASSSGFATNICWIAMHKVGD